MYSVTLNWIGTEIKWYLCEILTSRLITQAEFLFNHGMDSLHEYELSNVKEIFDRSVFPKYAAEKISLVIFVANAKLPLLGDEDNFVKQVENYLHGAGVQHVRFMRTPYFDATRALLDMKENGYGIKVGEEFLMIRGFGSFMPCDPAYVYVIKKTAKGWDMRKMRFTKAIHEIERNVNFVLNVLLACKVDLHSMKHMMVYVEGDQQQFEDLFSFFDQNHISTIGYFSHPTSAHAAMYLSKVYTNLTTELSSYVPVSYHWCLEVYKDRELLPICFSNKSILPCFATMNFDTTKRDDIVQLTLRDKEFLKTIPIPEVKNTKVRLLFAIGENGVLGLRIQFLQNGRFVTRMVYHPNVFNTFFPHITVTKRGIRTKYWNNGILVDVADVNGLVSIPLKISFLKDVPIVGSAAADKELKPVLHDLLDLFDDAVVNQKIQNGAKDLWLNSSGQVNVVVETSDGARKVAPITLLAVIIKSVTKLVEQSNEGVVEGIKKKDIENKSALIC